MGLDAKGGAAEPMRRSRHMETFFAYFSCPRIGFWFVVAEFDLVKIVESLPLLSLHRDNLRRNQSTLAILVTLLIGKMYCGTPPTRRTSLVVLLCRDQRSHGFLPRRYCK
jgi:hypothetical protein